MHNVKIIILLMAVLLVGCSAGPVTTFSVGAARGVDADAVAEAAAMWNAADERIHVALSDDPDVTVERSHDLPANHCGEWASGGTTIRLNADHMGKGCRDRLPSVIAHELGHFMAQRTDHVEQPYTLMYFEADELNAEPTPADIEYVLGGT